MSKKRSSKRSSLAKAFNPMGDYEWPEFETVTEEFSVDDWKTRFEEGVRESETDADYAEEVNRLVQEYLVKDFSEMSPVLSAPVQKKKHRTGSSKVFGKMFADNWSKHTMELYEDVLVWFKGSRPAENAIPEGVIPLCALKAILFHPLKHGQFHLVINKDWHIQFRSELRENRTIWAQTITEEIQDADMEYRPTFGKAWKEGRDEVILTRQPTPVKLVHDSSYKVPGPPMSPPPKQVA